MKNNKILAFSTAVLLAIGTMGSFSACAQTETTANAEQPKFQKPENEVIGKITAISESSVTISVAERKMPERDGNENKDFSNGQRPPFFDNNGQGFDGAQPPEKPNGEQPNFNVDNFFTLTGESMTIDISSATFDVFKRKDIDKSEETTEAKTYKDFAVGDYIMIELTSQTSKVAKSVRSANMMRGGFGPRGQKPNDDRTK